MRTRLPTCSYWYNFTTKRYQKEEPVRWKDVTDAIAVLRLRAEEDRERGLVPGEAVRGAGGAETWTRPATTATNAHRPGAGDSRGVQGGEAIGTPPRQAWAAADDAGWGVAGRVPSAPEEAALGGVGGEDGGAVGAAQALRARLTAQQ